MWHIIDGFGTFGLLSRYILIRSSGIDSILSLCSFGVHFRLSRVLLFASQVRIILDGIFLSVSCLSHRILSVCLGCWRLWHCVDGLRAFILLSCYIRVRSCSINGILSLSCFGVYLGLSCVFLFTSQVRIILDGILLSVGCLSYRVFSISFRCWGLWHCINRVLTSIFLSRYIRIAGCSIDGILSLCSFCVYLGLSSILLFTSQVRIILDGILLRICRLSDRILGVCFSCRGLWHCVNRVLTSIFLSRYIRVACCSIDGVFCFLRFSINFCFCSILLFAS